MPISKQIVVRITGLSGLFPNAACNLAASILAASILAGCVQELPIDPINQSVPVAYSKTLNTERVSGKAQFLVRSFETEDGKDVEVAGADCTMNSAEFSSSFTTPAIVMLPNFYQSTKFENRGKPSHVRLECKRYGKVTTTSFRATDKRVKPDIQITNPTGTVTDAVVKTALAYTSPWQFPPSIEVYLDAAPLAEGEKSPATPRHKFLPHMLPGQMGP